MDDLAFVEADAIAWSVNARLQPITPLLRRLERAGGPELAAQMRTSEPLAVGSAIVTGAGALNAELLISAVVSSDSEPVTRESVRRATLSALQRAADWQVAQLACAPFGLGAGNLDIEESAEVMLEVMTRQAGRAAHPGGITIVVESASEEEAFSSRLARGAP
ncbi:MAG: macro domain-containing protein [Gemmatimonadota bacterium]|nr:macro domain-containing protein [Gemmatimonadota bacterium]